MSEERFRRIDERDKGRRRLRWVTSLTAATGVALSSLFGFAVAHRGQAAKAPEQNQVTNSPSGTGGTPSSTATPTITGSNGGPGIEPPPQPPTTTTSRGHVNTGGS
jgi:hypothetical protein